MAGKGQPAGNIKLGISLDSTSFGNTLDEINAKVKQAESNMRANLKAYDSAGRSYEALSQKTKDLSTVMEGQNAKVRELTKRRDEAISKYGEESKQVANLNTQINNATAKYNAYSRQLNDTKKELVYSKTAVNDLSNEIKENERQMNAEVKALKAAGDESGAFEAKQKGLAKQTELSEKAIEEQRKVVKLMADEFGDSANETEDAKRALEKLERQSKISSRQLEGVTNALSELEREASNVDDKVDKAGDALEEAGKQGNKAEDGFKNATKEFSALATGLAVSISTKALDMAIEAADSLKESFNEVVEASNTFQGKLGITKDGSEYFLNFANDLVKSGMVETLEEAQDAITQVYQTAGQKVSPEGMKELTKYAISFSNTFDTDVNETMRGASRMMENFGISGKEAFDLLTVGAQNGLNQSNELADNMAEYSQLFGQMGFTADETFSLLAAGLDGGAYNLDKVNDLIKEMGISLTDGRFEENADMFSEATRNLFNEWKNGKATQGAVVKSMMNDFSNMEGGYEALNKAGTVWSALGEDNSLKVIKAMAGASDSFGDAEGAAEDLNNTVTNTTAWEAFTNGVKGTVNSIAIWAQEFTGGMTQPIENFFNNTLPNAMKTLDFFFSYISTFISNLKDVIGKMWTGQDTISDQHILNMMGFSWESIWALDDFITQVKEKGETLTQYIKGFWQLFTGDEATQMQGYSLLRSLGMSQEDIEALETAKENIKTAFDSVKEVIKKLLEEGLNKMIQAWKDLVKIWDDKIAPDLLPLLQQFSGWLGRITGDLAYISGALDNFGGSGKRNSSIIIDAFTILWETLKIKLGLIMATIETTMIIISSTIKIWSNIFKGDWSAAWEEIKLMYQRIGNAIWQNIKNTFVGKIITTLGEFYERNKKIFEGIWETITGILFAVPGFVFDIFTKVPQRMVEAIKGGKSAVVAAFKEVFNAALRAIGRPVNGIIKGASWVLEKLGGEPLKEWKVPQYAKGTPAGGHPINGPMMVNDGRGAEAVITPNGQAFIPRGRNVVLNAPKGTHVLTAEETAYMTGNKAPRYRYAKGTGFFGNLWNNVKGFAGNVGNTLKNVVGDVWDFISDPGALARKVLNGLGVLEGLVKYPLDVGKGILSKATEALTNKITELFSSGSLDTSMGMQGVYKYLADVAVAVMKKFPGFQVTSGYREGDPYSHGKHNAIDIALPGVVNGSPRYTEAANYAFEKFANKIGYVITNGKVRDRSGQSGTGVHDDWRIWPDGDHYDHVHLNGVRDPQGGLVSGGDSVGGSGVERWRPYVKRALKMNNLPTSSAYVDAWMRQIQTESGGNPLAIGGNDGLADGNATGLLQTKPGTFAANAFPGYGNIMSGFDNILAAINYAKKRYGSDILGVIGRGHGYANGGIVNQHQIAEIAEGNKPEIIIPLDKAKRSRAMQLLAIAQDKLGVKPKSVNNSSDSSGTLETLVSLMIQQNNLLSKLLAKDTSVKLDGKPIADNTNGYLGNQFKRSLYTTG
ncbi:phage tail tape measure protein [Enterococcus faecium]|uniref:phage tail tape measure protein n=1 Tax=Enterococcus faecium TaxID=1352 RepID=UPI000C279670|nr:phage tail tape measure protein [Enterococcus faecium]PJO84475.1 tape measure protein [Enterococcus faecium]RXA60652.1 tape measure protein [Enterococcus faecium]RXA83377.1 tape measure protein [Enterococcus faecium]TBV29513.1 tape measure protein [Enterococcus faecium]TBV29836.1 tape measure protein [Enterococcus faecium]